MNASRRSDLLFLLFLLSLSVALNVYQYRTTPAASGPVEPTVPLVPGKKVPPLKVKDRSGRTITLDLSARGRTIVYVFTTWCPFCQQNAARVKRLADDVVDRYQLIGISLDDSKDLSSYLSTHAFKFPVYKAPDSETKREYGMGSVPQTILVEDGRVTAVWNGMYSGKVAAEMATKLGVTITQPVMAAGCADENGMFYAQGAVFVVTERRGTLRGLCTQTGEISYTQVPASSSGVSNTSE